MEEDIQNYLQTIMFRGTPCSKIIFDFAWGKKKISNAAYKSKIYNILYIFSNFFCFGGGFIKHISWIGENEWICG